MSTKSISRYKTLLTTQVENLYYMRFLTLEPQWRNGLKEVGYTYHEKSNCPRSNGFMIQFHAFVSTLNYVSPIGANSDERRWSCDEGLLVWDRELSTCLTANYKKRINSR